MRFEMFTEHEVELFALNIIFFNLNDFFLSICIQHTDKNVPRKWLLGGIFLILCTAGLLELLGALSPGPTGGLIVVGWRSCLTQCCTVTEVKHGRARSGVGWVTAQVIDQ